MKTSGYIITTTLGGLLVMSLFFSVRKRKRDQRASKLIPLISSKLQSSSDSLSSENAFDIHYLSKVIQQTDKSVIVLQKSAALEYVDQIHSAFKPWYLNDDEEQIYSVFRSLKDKVQVSQIAKAYQESYSENLIDVFKERLSTSEINIIMGIVSHLPSYRTSV